MGMLILVSGSEAKRAVRHGKPFDAAGLSFPQLAPTRDAVLQALVQVSARPDATTRLGVRDSLRDVVRANVTLRDAPAGVADEVYSGVLFEAIGAADLDAASRRRARKWIVAVSALWGALRLGDRIPTYRLNMCGRLPGLAHLPQVWQPAFADVLPTAAGRGLVVDFRAADYLTAWRPTGPLADRTVAVKVVRDLQGGRGAGSHNAKHTGGLVVRRIVTDALDPHRPDELVEALSAHFEVDLRPPGRPGQPWQMLVLDANSSAGRSQDEQQVPAHAPLM
jgi:cytoplasmic iron level regulating protein YaaA (DUF328/UPF0246 family)